MPTVSFLEVVRPVLVLGSTQPEAVVDPVRVAAAGVGVARRRSGGGAVLVRPGELVWVDVLVPAGDRRWEPDVGRAFGWLGRAWAGALGSLGVVPAVHAGPPVPGPWSGLVCFGGLGPGEVTVGGRKVVGISQRRTAKAALFQCAALLRWDPGPLLELLALGDGDRARAAGDLAGAGGGIEATPARVEAALATALRRW